MHAVDHSGNELSFVIHWWLGFHHVIISQIVPFQRGYQHCSPTFQPDGDVFYFIAINEHKIQTGTFVHDVLTVYDAIFDSFHWRRHNFLHQNQAQKQDSR